LANITKIRCVHSLYACINDYPGNEKLVCSIHDNCDTCADFKEDKSFITIENNLKEASK